MNEKALRVLEYGKVIESLTNLAGSESARAVIAELQPSNDPDMIQEGLDETSEAVTLIVHKGPLPMGNLYDIKDQLALAQKGGSLTMRQLLRVLYNMSVARSVVSYLKGDLPPLPILKGMSEVLEIFRDLEEDIDRCIISEEEMSDHASVELRNIRRSMVRQNESIKARLNQILNSDANKTYLQDTIITIRDGRYVVPVKQEHRTHFSGIVHDQSASGATLFIEPQVIVNMNNELRQLEAQEKAEIERILWELSGRVGEHAKPLMNNQELLVAMDVINAKGKLSVYMKAERPTLNEDNSLLLLEARHPLIDRSKVVPINVSLGSAYHALIITGPNTGGKTVTLKTVGLLAMMTQTGLHIPASSLSKMPIYNDIFADIGDEQSIEQSLSTFSSHMNNIVSIIDKAEAGTLVLLDELGAGTDPTEGAALAIAILEHLRSKNASIMATTHYTELKKYAISTAGVENASMEFDVETLSPTYKLTVGIPGKSNAFEISSKLGLKGDIIEKARNLLKGGDIKFEEVIAAMEADRKAAEAERDQAIALNIEMKRQKDIIDALVRKTEEQKEKTLNQAREEARNIISGAKELSEEVRAELKELSKIESMGERTQRFDNNRKRIKDAAGQYRERLMKEVNDNPVRVEDLRIGDRVKVLTLSQNGEILSLPDDKGDLMVQVGRMKVKSNVDDLKLIIDGKSKLPSGGKTTYGQIYKTKARSISISINVQGQNLDDASEEVDKYLDDAFIAGLSEVTIIHGRGEGVLLNGLRNLMKNHKHVAGFRKGSYNEGGDGVTVVQIKQN
jgi:DNA mismatch repair protein MutS2